MNQKELITWLTPQFKLDIIEQGKRPMSRICWGKEDFEPKCWASNMGDWKLTANPKHPQINLPKDVNFVEVLKETVKNRLIEKGIFDESNHISRKYTKEMATRKKRKRGIHTKETESISTNTEDELENDLNLQLEESVLLNYEDLDE